MRYIKIAAMLPNRTIRDVALRCWWATVKSLLSYDISSSCLFDSNVYSGLILHSVCEQILSFATKKEEEEDVQLLNTLLAFPLFLLFAISRGALAFH